MKRLSEKQITAWKHSPRRKPLIIRGARQVGKTWLGERPYFLAGVMRHAVDPSSWPTDWNNTSHPVP